MSQPSKFDTSDLDKTQLQTLEDFHQRRNTFNNYLEERGLELFTCPCCAYPTLTEKSGHEICPVCYWQADGQDDEEADEVWEGPSDFSLTESRIRVGKKLNNVAEQTGGNIIKSPSTVLYILSIHNVIRAKFLDSIPEDILLVEKLKKRHEDFGRTLINDLVTILKK